MNNPEISVIVPVYKVESYLKKCIESILSQTFDNFELILVDDGSPDRCGEICDEYAQKDNRIKVVHKENGGLSSARNIGIDIARAKYINFIDSDDWIEKESLETLYKLANETGADIVQGKGVIAKNEKKRELIKKMSFNTYTNIQALHELFNYEGGEIRVVAFNKLYSRNLFEDLRYPEGIIHEDEYLTPRLIYKANKIVVIDSQLYNYRLSENSIMRSEFSIKNLDKLYVLNNISEFYEFINQYDLKKKTEIIYILALIDSYKKVYKNIDNKEEILNKLKVDFNNLYGKIIKFSDVNIKIKIFLTLFKISPKFASKII